jgi:hypothetical protein
VGVELFGFVLVRLDRTSFEGTTVDIEATEEGCSIGISLIAVLSEVTIGFGLI